MTAPPPLLQLRGVQKYYGDTKALVGLTLSMTPGEVLGLLGPNGAGKTTCLRILMGQLSPSAGEAEVMGLSCTHDRKGVMGHIGYVPDEPSFFEDLKGEEILQWSGGLRGLSPEETRLRSAPLIERLELGGAMSKAAGTYSHGMTKKLALTLALLHEPSLLILDEPTAGLDPKGIQTLVDLLKERRSAGAGVLYSTHLLEQAEGLCDRVAILKGGMLMGLGTLDELHLEAQGRQKAGSPAQDATPRDLKSIFFTLTQGGGPPPLSSPSPFIHLLTRELSLGLRRRWRILTKGGASSIALILLGLLPLLMTLLLGINLAQSRLLEQLEGQSRSPSPMVINPLVYQSLRLATHAQDASPSKAPVTALREGLQRAMGPKAPSPDTLPDITRRYQSKGLSAFAPYGPGPLQIRPSSALKPTLAHRHQALSAWAILLILFASGLTLLTLGLGLGTLPSRRGELAWLLTHPLSEEAILGSRILTQGLLSPLALLFTTPALTALLMTWGAPLPLPLSLITAYALALGVAALGSLGELATQGRIEDSQLAPWRGGILLLGAGALMSVPLLLAEVGTKGDPPLLMTLSGVIPTLKLLDQGGMRALVMLTFGACLASALFGLRYGAQLLREGALPAPTTAGAPLPGQGPNPSLDPGPSLASPVRMVGRRLLRSPGRFASACLLPLLLGAIWMGLGEAYFLEHLPGLGGAAALAFAFGGAVILLGSAESFSREHPSLWLILAHAREPMAHFEPKARFWAGVGIVYGLLGLVGLLQIGWEASWGGTSYVGIMLGGLWVMAHLGVALSILFPRRDAHGMAPIGMYGFVLMGGLFVYALTRPGPFEAAAPALLATLGCVALWIRAKERLPWALDPAPPSMPPSPLINGLIALMIFYVGQGVLGALLQSLGPAWQLEGAIVAFAGAGLGATLWLGISLGRGELMGRMLRPPKGESVLRGLLPGLTWGLALVGIGVGWLDMVERWPELRSSWEGLDDLGVYGEGSIWLWVMGVILAPVVEEMLFRGAILKGLMATFGPWGSIILTSLTFTALHPGVSAPPIFLLGVITGRITLKTGWLGSAILCHALYNLAVLLARAGGVGPG